MEDLAGSLKVLNDDEIKAIHSGSLKILEDTGVEIPKATSFCQIFD